MNPLIDGVYPTPPDLRIYKRRISSHNRYQQVPLYFVFILLTHRSNILFDKPIITMRFSSALNLAFASACIAAPAQQVLSDGGPSRPNDPDFPVLQPLPFNGTIPGIDYDLIAKLKTSPNAVTRAALLPDSAFKFDFVDPPNVPSAKLQGRGGTLTNAIGSTMPALIGNGASMAVGFTKPCG